MSNVKTLTAGGVLAARRAAPRGFCVSQCSRDDAQLVGSREIASQREQEVCFSERGVTWKIYCHARTVNGLLEEDCEARSAAEVEEDFLSGPHLHQNNNIRISSSSRNRSSFIYDSSHLLLYVDLTTIGFICRPLLRQGTLSSSSTCDHVAVLLCLQQDLQDIV